MQCSSWFKQYFICQIEYKQQKQNSVLLVYKTAVLGLITPYGFKRYLVRNEDQRETVQKLFYLCNQISNYVNNVLPFEEYCLEF